MLEKVLIWYKKNKISFYRKPNINIDIQSEKDMIKNIKFFFTQLQTMPDGAKIYQSLFRILKVIPQASVNGKTFTIGFYNNINNLLNVEESNSELIVKVALNNNSDSLSYEYYIGNTLNTLRMENKTSIFSLVYGRKYCGLPGMSSIKICDEKNESKTHLFYEYVRNPRTGTVTSFSTYIDRMRYLTDQDQIYTLEKNIVNILILLMHGLQIAQDTLDFTHYDLHASNVLIIELSEPEIFKLKYKVGDRNKEINVVSNVIPYIIDYGRSFVIPSKVKKDPGFSNYRDFDLGTENLYFSVYQQDNLDNNNKWIFTNEEYVQKVDKMINAYITENYAMRNDKYKNNIKKYIINNIFNKDSPPSNSNYTQDNGKINLSRYHFGIGSRKNKKYDFFRLINHVIDQLSSYTLNRLAYQDIWISLKNQLKAEYPFYDPQYYSLPCEYHIKEYEKLNSNLNKGPWGHWIEKPIDICEILYNVIKKDELLLGSNEIFFRNLTSKKQKLQNLKDGIEKLHNAYLNYDRLNKFVKRELDDKRDDYDIVKDRIIFNYNYIREISEGYKFENSDVLTWTSEEKFHADLFLLYWNTIETQLQEDYEFLKKFINDLKIKHNQTGGRILLNKNEIKLDNLYDMIPKLNDSEKNKNEIKLDNLYDMIPKLNDSEKNINEKTSCKDEFLDDITDAGPMYTKYVESDLIKRVKEYNKENNLKMIINPYFKKGMNMKIDIPRNL